METKQILDVKTFNKKPFDIRNATFKKTTKSRVDDDANNRLFVVEYDVVFNSVNNCE